MEDQGKRLLLAVAIVAVMWFGYMYFFAPKVPPQQATGGGATPATQLDAGPGSTTAAAAPAGGAAGAGPTVSRCNPAEAGSVKIETARVQATFSECGGALSGWTLLGSQYTEKDPQGKKVPANMVPRQDGGAFLPLQVSFPESTAALDPGAKWTLTKKSEVEVEATLTTDTLQVTKLFTVDPKTYAVDLTVSFKNVSSAELAQNLQIDTYGYQDPKAPESSTFSYAEPHHAAACYLADELRSDKATSLTNQPNIRSGPVAWAGIDHKYFLFAVAPRIAATQPLACVTRGFSDAAGVMRASLRLPTHKLAPGTSAEYAFTVYAGPKLLEHLEAVSERGGGDLKLQKSVDLGWFSFLARPMLWLLSWFHDFLANWGLAIILLTITVKLLTLYWTTKSMRSMKAMAKLKPKMEELQKKYADDRQRMNVEMMNLYKTHGVNPLGGCLPMLLQMPVWFALYSALQNSAEIYQAPFVGWLQDLTRPDPYYIVPVVVTGLMFFQQKMTPTTIDSAQQRMMLIMMPLMFGVFSLFFPAGLTVYILTNTLLTMVHQLWMNATDPDKPAPAAAAVAASSDAGGGGKGEGKGGGGGGGGGKGGGKGGQRKPAKA